MVAELTALRDQIDAVDKALLDLLAKRMELVAEVGEVKSQYGLPIYVPEREASMLASRRKEAAAMGVPPDLIEDVLRRVMRESYSSENDKGFKTLCPSLRPVVIVGGDGQMGRLFEKMLTLSGYQVRTLEKEDWARAPELVADAGMVIVSVPIHVTEQVIAKLPPLPSDCILVDLCSVKAGPLQAMLSTHAGPVVGLHPMFGPDSGSLAKQVVVYCDGRQPEAYQWFLEQIQVWGRAYTVSAPSSTIRTWRLFRRYVTLRPLLTAYIWLKKTYSSNNCWRSPHRFTVWNWRWLDDCLPRIRSCTQTLLCHQATIWR
ncbi:T-protein [Kluyvera intermedia]|nr:T-protein [Kluyvera intermedia]